MTSENDISQNLLVLIKSNLNDYVHLKEAGQNASSSKIKTAINQAAAKRAELIHDLSQAYKKFILNEQTTQRGTQHKTLEARRDSLKVPGLSFLRNASCALQQS